MSNLPILDISNLRTNPDGSAAQGTAIQLRDICHNTGFCYIIGHGMSARHLKLAAQMQAFFALPLDERKTLNLINSRHFRGYTLLGNEVTGGEQDWRDQLDFCDELPAPKLSPHDPAWLNLRGPNQWPEALPSLRPAVTEWMGGMYDLGTLLTRALAVGLGLNADYFADYFEPRGDSRVKLIRYRMPATGGSSQGVGWHHDTGFLTFIKQDQIGGLQVDIDGQIIDATPIAKAGEDARCCKWLRAAICALHPTGSKARRPVSSAILSPIFLTQDWKPNSRQSPYRQNWPSRQWAHKT